MAPKKTARPRRDDLNADPYRLQRSSERRAAKPPAKPDPRKLSAHEIVLEKQQLNIDISCGVGPTVRKRIDKRMAELDQELLRRRNLDQDALLRETAAIRELDRRGQEHRQDPRHNHITRDIKRRGVCPACDLYHDRRRPKDEDDETATGWTEGLVEKAKKAAEDSLAQMTSPPTEAGFARVENALGVDREASTTASPRSGEHTRAPTSPPAALSELVAKVHEHEWQRLWSAIETIQEQATARRNVDHMSPSQFVLWAINELCRAVPR